jgi:DnaJ family protein A protein 2
MDCYSVLGINKNATSAQIKKAYHKCAQSHHPDKNGDANKFKRCNEAYNILSNEQKKNQYDRVLNSSPNIDPVHTELKVSLSDLYHGAIKTVKYACSTECSNCKGLGTKSTQDFSCDCFSGHRFVQAQTFQGQIEVLQPCQICNGSGVNIPKIDQCEKCFGTKSVKINKSYQIDVKPGLKWNKKLKFPKQGHLNKGDLIVKLINQGDDLYNRYGDNLVVEHEITLVEALSGKNISFEHLNKSKVVLMTNQIIQPGSTFKISNLGMPVFNSKRFGDLYIVFQVRLNLDEEVRKEFIKLFPSNHVEGDQISMIEVNDIPVGTDSELDESEPKVRQVSQNVQCAQQ